jgi:hypothetical protein
LQRRNPFDLMNKPIFNLTLELFQETMSM